MIKYNQDSRRKGVPKFGTLFLWGATMAVYTRYVGVKFQDKEYEIIAQKIPEMNLNEFISGIKDEEFLQLFDL